MKLLKDSEYLSNEIIYKISEENFVEADSSRGSAKNEIPFKNLQANILLDCARTITDTEKAHVMYQVCALAKYILFFRNTIIKFWEEFLHHDIMRAS